ncbi:MAG: hypothetical protein LBF12_01190 [Christensenellaceae bacterium]|jgi:hypothetical protein|nr:hypothetical protein [Christensenellaceae bacterium]
MDANPDVDLKGMHAHHQIPQKYKDKLKKHIKALDHDIHLANSRMYNELWKNEIAVRKGLKKSVKRCLILYMRF